MFTVRYTTVRYTTVRYTTVRYREGICRRTGADNQITLELLVRKQSKVSMPEKQGKVFGGLDYVKDVEKKGINKPLWKHIVERHEGVMELTMFSHFTMKLIQLFSKPQIRKANEGVRIFHLNPDTRMNSKD